MVKHLLALVAALSACGLEQLDVTGKRCDAARRCPDELECVQGVCGTPRRDAGVRMDAGYSVNLLANPGFEDTGIDGGVLAWRTTPGQLAPSPMSRSGLRSGRVQTGAPQIPALYSDPVLAGSLDAYCARAWVRASADAGYNLSLQIRARLPDGGFQVSNGTGFARTKADTNWVKLVESFEPFGDELEVRVSPLTRLDAGEVFFVDDVELVRTPQSSLPCLP